MARDSFTNYVLDQLTALEGLRAKAMFGGHGLYHHEVFFAIVMAGRLYLNTNTRTQAAFLKRGMSPFIYRKGPETMALKYFEVPADVLEDRTALVQWAKTAIKTAATKKKISPKKPRPKRSKVDEGHRGFVKKPPAEPSGNIF